eukprot:jgi/Ulvmu1/8882/UM049_0064.1
MDEDSLLDRQSRFAEASNEQGERNSIDAHPARSPGLFSYFANVASPLTVGAARLLQARPFSGRAARPAATSPEPTNGVEDQVAAATIQDLQDGSYYRKAKPVLAHPSNSVEAILSDGGAAESQQEPSIELGAELPRPADSIVSDRPKALQTTVSGIRQVEKHHVLPERDPGLISFVQSAVAVPATSQPVQNPYSKLMQAVRRGHDVGSGPAPDLQPFAAAASPGFPPRPPSRNNTSYFGPRAPRDCALVPFDRSRPQPAPAFASRRDSAPPPQPAAAPEPQSSTPSRAIPSVAHRSKPDAPAAPSFPPMSGRSSAVAPFDRPALATPSAAIPRRRPTPPTTSGNMRALSPYQSAARPQAAYPKQSAGPPHAANSVTWIPTYTRTLAKRRAARVTFKPTQHPGHPSLLPAPPQRFGKRGREVDAEQGAADGTARSATRRRMDNEEAMSTQAQEIAQHILDAVNHIAQRRDMTPDAGALRALAAPRTPPAQNPLALTEQAWESLTSVALPEKRKTPLLSHLTPCTSVQAELARRQHEQRVAAASPAPRSAADHNGAADGFSFPAAQPVSDMLQAQPRRGAEAGRGPMAMGQRAALDVFGMMAGPSRALKPSMTIAQAQQQRRDEEAAAQKRRADAQPPVPPVPEFVPPQPSGADVMPRLDVFVESRRKAGLASSTNPCDFLKPLPGEEEPPSPRGAAAAGPADGLLSAAPAPIATAATAQQAAPSLTLKPQAAAQAAIEPSTADGRLSDDRPAKRRAPVESGWGDAFLKANRADEAAAKDAVAKEIEAQNPLASKPSGPTVSFGTGEPKRDASAHGKRPAVSSWGDEFLKSNKADVTAAQEAVAKEIEAQNPLANKSFAPTVNFGSDTPVTIGAVSASPLLQPVGTDANEAGAAPLFSFPAISAAPTAAAASAPASTALFGAPAASAGAPASADTAGPAASAPRFGTSAPSAASLFGSSAALFAPTASAGKSDTAAAGSQQTAATTAPPASSAPLFSFGGASAPLFGAAAAGTASASATASAATAPSTGLFAASARPAAGAAGSAASTLFGISKPSEAASPAALSSLFGPTSDQPKPASAAAPMFPFGTAPVSASGPAAAAPGGSSLFSAPAAAASQPATSVPQFSFGSPQPSTQKVDIKPIVFPGTEAPASASTAALAQPANAFGATPASAAQPAAAATQEFSGFPASGAGFLFGQSSAAASGFGAAAPVTTGTGLFGAGAASSSSLFGNPAAQAAAPVSAPAFGAAAPGAAAPGAAAPGAAVASPLFGSTPAAPAAQAAPADGFGGGFNPFSANVFAPASSAAMFGSAAPAAGGFVFGGSAPASAAFGQQQPAVASGAAFGSPAPSGGLFGAPAGAAGGVGLFNQPNPSAPFHFGGTPPAAVQPAAGAPAAAPNAFGGAAAPAGFMFPGAQAAPFGAPQQAAQGGPPAFGGQQQNPFGAAQAAPAGATGAPGVGQTVPAFVAGANTGAFNMGPSETRGTGGRRKTIAVRRRRT